MLSFNRFVFFILFLFSATFTWSSGIVAADDSVALFDKLKSKDPLRRIETLETIYLEYYFQNAFAGYPYAKEAYKLSIRYGYPEHSIKALKKMAYCMEVKLDFDSIRYYGNLLLDLGVQTRNKACEALAYQLLGESYRLENIPQKAIEYFQRSLMTDTTSLKVTASVCQRLGIIYADAGLIDKSTFYYLKSLQILEKLGNRINAGFIYANLSKLYDSLTNPGKFLEYTGKAMEVFREEKYLRGQGYMYNMIGSYYLQRKEYKAALENLYNSLRIKEKDHNSDPQIVAFTLTNIGDVYMAQGRYDSAMRYYKASMEQSQKIGDQLSLSCTYLSMGKLQKELGNNQTALGYVVKSYTLSKEINYRAQLEEVYALFSSLYQETGQPDLALEYLKKLKELRDSILTERIHKNVTDMLIKYESDKKDLTIKELTKTGQEDKIRYQTTFTLLLLLLGGLILLTGIAYYYYKSRVKHKVETFSYIQEKILAEMEGDQRKLRALKSVLPATLAPVAEIEQKNTAPDPDLLSQLIRLMEQEEAYLDPELNLASLAQKLGTNTTYLSRLINDHYQVNFSFFLSRYRIEKALQMIREDPQRKLSFEGIAHSVGFHSKSTFNHVFKTITGMTPGQYAKGVKANPAAPVL